jgi:prepilin-type N-terminal cleavage/methylation domain-containing protein
MKRKQSETGFTLVEIAIVLVIIGLLLGGILKGQEMITQAKIKNAITDFSGVSAAYFGYQDRYRATPGDDKGADRWTTSPAAIPGDGDRILSGTYNATCPTTAIVGTVETCLWWDHLRRSGFVSGSGAGQPNNAFNGMLGAQTGIGPAAGAAVTAALGGITNIMLCSTNLPDKVGIALDVQMDDGDVRTGAVRGLLQTGANPALPAAADTNNFVENGTNQYTLCRQF